MSKLRISVKHALPGRLRLQLSHPPVNWSENKMWVTKHEGINSVYYSEVSRTLLIYYDTRIVSQEEIILRAGLALSVEYTMAPVIIEKKEREEALDGLVYLSGAAIALGFITQAAGLMSRQLPLAAGALTAAAIINHGRKEIKKSGVFDPEVLSIIYLIPSLLNNNVLKASSITWLASFGRHFLFSGEEHLVLKAVKVKTDTNEPTFDVAVCTEKTHVNYKKVLQMIPVIIADGFLGMGLSNTNMIGRMKKISSSHNEQLEGLEGTNSRIFLKIR